MSRSKPVRRKETGDTIVANSVPNPVQRLRYFDGEYLRSYDFTDEQQYHIEMRRLMNLKLHLHGIVYGLEIVQDQDSVPASGIYFFSIAPGIAIDKSGREIVVPAPYSLTNVLTAPGLGVGCYEVWICYQESETGLPAAGYLDCNSPNQYTRWQESFQVQLAPTQGPSLVTDCGGVRLGFVNLIASPSGLGLAIQNPSTAQTYNVKRDYVGIRAQSVKAPDQIDASPDPFDITALTTPLPDKPLPGYLDVHPGVFNHGNVIVKKNLVVGDDFKLDNTVYKNLPSDFTKIPTGNVKITQDLFLNGDFYGFIDGNWFKLKDYIQTLMPNIVVGNITIPIPAGTTITGSSSTTVATTLSSVSAAPQVLLSISETDWIDEDHWHHWGTLGGIQIAVTGTLTNTSGKNWSLTVQWTVSPSATFGGHSYLPITGLVVNYMVVFTP
jgi:hypothetical protein